MYYGCLVYTSNKMLPEEDGSVAGALALMCFLIVTPLEKTADGVTAVPLSLIHIWLHRIRRRKLSLRMAEGAGGDDILGFL